MSGLSARFYDEALARRAKIICSILDRAFCQTKPIQSVCVGQKTEQIGLLMRGLARENQVGTPASDLSAVVGPLQ